MTLAVSRDLERQGAAWWGTVSVLVSGNGVELEEETRILSGS